MIKKLTISLLCLFIFSTCKKGEDDPAFTLQSRKNRLAGGWHLESGKLTETVNDHPGKIVYTRVFSFASNKYEAFDMPEDTLYKGEFILNVNIDKNGKFSFSEQFDGSALIGEGVWDFLHKSGDVKKKEEVNFIIGALSKGSSSDYHLFNWGLTNMRYKIKELRKEKLVLTVAEDALIDPKGYDVNYNGEFVFKQ